MRRPPSSASKRPSSASSTKAAWACINAIIPDELLHRTGVFKERLSQSSLYAAMQQVSDVEAQAVLRLAQHKGMKFRWGQNEETELTERADSCSSAKCILPPCASRTNSAVRAIGIQYQQGLKDLAPGQRSGGRIAQQRGSSAGEARKKRPSVVRRRSRAAFQRGGRMRRARWPGHLPSLARTGFCP